MSARKYLSELSAERLIGLFDVSEEVESEQAADRGVPLTHVLFEDLRQNYPGPVEAAEHVWEGLEANGADGSFMAGAMAGSLLMLHIIRLAAERDEIDSTPMPPSD